MDLAHSGTVSVFSAVTCTAHDGTEINLSGRRSRELVAFLATAGEKPLLRDTVAGTLWPDTAPPNARKALNTEVWRLRRSLRDQGADPDRWIAARPETLGLVVPGGPWVDLSTFLSIADGRPDVTPEAARQALELYTGDFAAGLEAEWIDEQRRRLQRCFTKLLHRAALAYQNADRLSEAITLAERLVREDPLDEETRRLLLKLQIRNGNHSAALREYADLEKGLREELGVSPSARTQAIRNLCFMPRDEQPGYRIEREEVGYRVEVEDSIAPSLASRILRLRGIAEALNDEIDRLEGLLDRDD